MMLLRSKNLKARRARDVLWQHKGTRGLEPLVLQGNAEVDREGEIETKSQSHSEDNREGEIETKSQSHSEDNREEDKGKGNGERGHTE